MKTKFAYKNLHGKISALFLVLILASDFSISQNTQVTWYSFNMGYAEPKVGNTMVRSVVGQSFIGTTQLANTQVISGFLADTMFSGMIVDIKNQEQLPVSYSLWQNYPNPFNPSTTIHYELPKESHVILKVYNMLGQEVTTLVNEKREAGRYEVTLDGAKLTSGVYFYRLQARPIDGGQANDYVDTKKLLLLK